jgi:serine/threonine protein kinase
MEPVTGVTLDLYLKQRASHLSSQASSLLMPGPSQLPGGTTSVTQSSTEPLQRAGTSTALIPHPSLSPNKSARLPGLATAASAAGRVSGAGAYQQLHAGRSSSSASSEILGPLERQIFMQLVMGVAHVHAAGLIHRDIKPSNVFVSPITTTTTTNTAPHPLFASSSSGAGAANTQAQVISTGVSVKLADFGLSVALDSEQQGSGRPGLHTRSTPSRSTSATTTTTRASSASFPLSSPRNPSSLAPVAEAPAGPSRGAGGDTGFMAGHNAAGSRRTGGPFANVSHTPGGSQSPGEEDGAANGTAAQHGSSHHTSGVGTPSYSAPEQATQVRQPASQQARTAEQDRR